jgi:hypothetical protein
LFPYNVDDMRNEDERLRLPAAKGNEAIVYLTWIMENYDNLPQSAVFVHGHRESWHQDDAIEGLIGDLNLHALSEIGYISLRCLWKPSCPAEIDFDRQEWIVLGPGAKLRKKSQVAIDENWQYLFPDELRPNVIASPCCAQFAVTREVIRRRPRSDYDRMREWLIDTPLGDDISGRVFEKLWAYIFTGQGVQYESSQSKASIELC